MSSREANPLDGQQTDEEGPCPIVGLSDTLPGSGTVLGPTEARS